jgi:hypothetical protein
MRIIIEVDDRTGATTQVAPELGLGEAQNAGAPSEELLRLVEAGVPELQSTPEAGSTMNAGSPPEWLRETIEASISTGLETTATTAGDAGAAPTIEE